MATAAVARAEGPSLVLQQEIPNGTTLAALGMARASGVRTILNISPFDQASARLSRLADIAIANQHEWLQLSGGCDLQEWSLAHQQTVVVTKGPDGVAIASPSVSFEIAVPVIRPMDTVGAGDTFCGDFAAVLDAGGSLRDAAITAVSAASLACLKAGAQASTPLRENVFAALRHSK